MWHSTFISRKLQEMKNGGLIIYDKKILKTNPTSENKDLLNFGVFIQQNNMELVNKMQNFGMSKC